MASCSCAAATGGGTASGGHGELYTPAIMGVAAWWLQKHASGLHGLIIITKQKERIKARAHVPEVYQMYHG